MWIFILYSGPQVYFNVQFSPILLNFNSNSKSAELPGPWASCFQIVSIIPHCLLLCLNLLLAVHSQLFSRLLFTSPHVSCHAIWSFSCHPEIRKQRHEYSTVQLFTPSLLAAKLHGCLHMVIAFRWREGLVMIIHLFFSWPLLSVIHVLNYNTG